MGITFNKKVPCNGLVKTIFASVYLQILSYPSWVLSACKLFRWKHYAAYDHTEELWNEEWCTGTTGNCV